MDEIVHGKTDLKVNELKNKANDNILEMARIFQKKDERI
jgi:hypothetical protein